MKLFIRYYIYVHVTAVTIALMIQNFILMNIIRLYNFPIIIYMILSGCTIYYCLYLILCWIYENYVWKWRFFLKRYNIGGTWYHEFREQLHPEYLRRGKTFVSQNAININFNSVNYDGENPNIAKRTLWNSTSVNIEEDYRFIISYIAHVSTYTMPDECARERKIICPEKTGIMYITIYHNKNGKPVKMVGIFHDSSIPFRRGVITFCKEVPWKDEIDSIECNIGT